MMAFIILLTAPAALAAQKIRILKMPSANTQGVRTIQAQLLVDAPTAIVWQAMTDYNDIDDILPGYSRSVILSTTGNTKVLDLAMKPAPLLPSYRYQVRATEHQNLLTFERIKGDLKYLKARYQLAPKNGGQKTLVTYTLSIDPGSNLPGTNNVLRSHTERSIYALAAHVETIAKKSLIGQR